MPVPEYRFHPVRRWRFDLAWPALLLAVEVDGGTWVSGRHTRGAGYERDCEKLNAAVLLGWRVLRFTTGQVTSGQALTVLSRPFGRSCVLRPLCRFRDAERVVCGVGRQLSRLLEFYAPSATRVLDVTFGSGTLTKRARIPVVGVDQDLTTTPSVYGDSRRLPFVDEAFGVAVYDPPYSTARPRCTWVRLAARRGTTTVDVEVAESTGADERRHCAGAHARADA